MATNPEETILGKVKNQFAAALARATLETKRRAYASYLALSRQLGRNTPGNTLMTENKDRLVGRLAPKHIGRICMFFYDPKTKDKLPYFDRFPLIIPIEFYSDGFLGLNLHYLPQTYRARLMDVLYNTVYSDNKYLDERRTLQISYQIVKSATRSKLFKPCVKRYLNGHVRSRFFIVDPQDWQIVLFLPTERFEKQNTNVVYKDSLRKIRG